MSGLLYQLSGESLAVLDRYEGHPDFYVRCRVCVADEWGRRRFAHAYCLPPRPEAPPATRYFKKILRAYERLGLNVGALRDALRSAA